MSKEWVSSVGLIRLKLSIKDQISPCLRTTSCNILLPVVLMSLCAMCFLRHPQIWSYLLTLLLNVVFFQVIRVQSGQHGMTRLSLKPSATGVKLYQMVATILVVM